MEFFFDLFENTKLAKFALVLLFLSGFVFFDTISSSPFYSKITGAKYSRSKEAKIVKKRIRFFSIAAIIISLVLLYNAIGLHKKSHSEKQPVKFANDLPTLPTLPKDCIPEELIIKKFALVSDGYETRDTATLIANQLEYLSFSNVSCEEAPCDDIFGLDGAYWIFLERPYNTMNSARAKFKECSRILKKNNFPINLKIVKMGN